MTRDKGGDLVSLEYGFCLEEVLGRGGVPAGSLDRQPQAEDAMRALDALRSAEETNFTQLPYRQEKELSRIEEFADSCRGRHLDAVVVGIGGSSLGPRAVTEALATGGRDDSGGGYLRISYLDTVDPTATRDLLDRTDPARTLYLIVTKSGTTVETLAHLEAVRSRLTERVGVGSFPRHLVAITDPERGPLRALASSEGWPSFPIPPGVGGRYSVLSPVGLLPAALAGIDPRQLLGGAASADARTRQAVPTSNPALLLAVLHFLFRRDRGVGISVMMPYRNSLKTFGEWYAQLLAESLGKASPSGPVGFTPAVAVGTTDQHSQVQLYMEGPSDKLLLFLRVEDHGTDVVLPRRPALEEVSYLAGKPYSTVLNGAQRATAAALAGAGRPSATIVLPRLSAYTLGQLFWHFEAMVALLGRLLSVDAFNQPGVEEGKRNLAALMGKPGTEDRYARLREALKKAGHSVR